MKRLSAVEFEGRAGVWFLSLDAASGLAAWAGRRWFHLPYHRACMSVQLQGEQVEYASHRSGASLEGSYGPLSPPCEAVPGTLEHWLTERYCLFARAPDGGTWRCDVHHAPWPLQDARADIRTNTMLAAHGIDVGSEPPLLHFARRLDVVIWPPVQVAAAGR